MAVVSARSALPVHIRHHPKRPMLRGGTVGEGERRRPGITEQQQCCLRAVVHAGVHAAKESSCVLGVIPMPFSRTPWSILCCIVNEYASASGARRPARTALNMHMPPRWLHLWLAAETPRLSVSGRARHDIVRGVTRVRRAASSPSHLASPRSNGDEQRGPMTDKHRQNAAHAGPRTSLGWRA
jgi:hypothetical protein